MAASSSRRKITSPFHNRKPSSPFSSSSSSSSLKQLIHRSSSSSSSSYYASSGNGYGSRSTTSGAVRADSMYAGYGGRSSVGFSSSDELIGEPDGSVLKSGGGDSISVTVRFRPLSERECQRGDEIAWYADGDKLVRNEYNPVTSYAFDRVFGSSAVTQEVYEVAARPVVKTAMEGVNGTVFAYGVTSSGKTHTMHGDHHSPGIIPLAIKDVFSIIQDTPGREFLLRVSYLEIYNEVINDLLDPTGQNLRVREDAQGTYVEGIKEEVVLSPGHALSFIAAGEEHRHVGSNNFNLLSSRSHTIFTLMIESSAHGDEYDGVIFSQLNLIDLAGSESSKTETTGLRRKEGSYINKSLLTLGTVIGKLSEGKASHVPYRDSKLTRLLQSSLSGHGHVSLICTITPASSNMEETHNTLKFASRAKRVEIYASRNKIIDEKSLIKKYQREISVLKQELDQLRSGMLVGVNPEEIMSLKLKLEEGQVKMQSRLEEEEEAKAALMSRIQRLTKLILVSSKNTIPGLTDVSAHQRSFSANGDDNGPMLLQSENPSGTPLEISYELKHRSSSNLSAAGSTIGESTQAGDIINGSGDGAKLPTGVISIDQMDLLVEQVKMLAGEIAFSSSTMKRLVEQSANDPESSKTQIENLEREIEEKRRQMRVLEKQIIESNEASISNTSLADMQQTMMRLMTQCDEKGFELEIKTADNRILQEQLQNKCSENKELQERITLLEQQLAAAQNEKALQSSRHRGSEEYIDELRKKIKIQEVKNEKLKREHVQILEQNSGLSVQNQKLSEEASYAKELASDAAVELKNLAGEVTKLSLQNAKLEKDLATARETNRPKPERNGRISGRVNDEFDLDIEDLRRELHTTKQREAKLEAALAEKEVIENEYVKKAEESKKKEAILENDLANMWVLVAELKKEVNGSNVNNGHVERNDVVNELRLDDHGDLDDSVKERWVVDVQKVVHDVPKEEPLVARLKARMQEMKEKDANSHVCKVCFESPTTTMLLPCRHFSLCKSCSVACSECPICRTKTADRIFAFTA
ncbi:putative plus-end-directed kinesin ATPase transcription factor C2H2 family [Helianthus annuus]|uniref:Plus-end-directed kinesin ATPase transcription factor C2H2 family n=1 Tax=Helianthus annuus TaxID=4232 RepID=A0A251RXW3_HELAN|nr:kinesin-like protein KIN-7D, mitochondrial [Helianthus annuus]KAF5758671.1 putative plus-end-directed kinesin ATPase transcription factor C2H2 family [Helianthus annuus]KAJ0436980.1 putative plus-end-directed kinesin ATPase transcription factor C2H2 family [Helianthus annuus]KAJ0441301.1 putative plus-end-directed kinesin ATPase transcription factor C2H2 family [Helianthus annuus]KAJ0459292.1 putative plus-end-directed kinesin ATPase transcription factor C2H2 family [Helianthus annuus]